MVVENKTETLDKENINDDLAVQEDKMAALKAMMKKKEVMPINIVEKKRRSLNIGVIGTGQAGSRLCEQWYALGYSAIVMNTAAQDLEQINVPEGNKLLLEYGIGGAAKNLLTGKDAADTHRDAIAELVGTKLEDAQLYMLCTSLGGGSGAGSLPVLIDILSTTGKPIVVMAVLPTTIDDAQTKDNALATLAAISRFVQEKVVSNLIVVDNAKLESIYSDVSHMDFFAVGNRAIVEPLEAFNHFSAMSSLEKSLDPMEWAKLFTDGEGLCIYGDVTVNGWQDDNTAIAKAVIENFDNGLLASGFNLAQAKYAGALIVANKSVWSQIPRGSVDYAMAIIQEHASGAEGVFRGTYVDDSIKDSVVRVYSMFSGLGLPDSRVQQLRKDVEVEKSRTAQRAQSRNLNLTLDTGKDQTISKADEVRQKIAKTSSTFSKNFVGSGAKDLRKK